MPNHHHYFSLVRRTADSVSSYQFPLSTNALRQEQTMVDFFSSLLLKKGKWNAKIRHIIHEKRTILVNLHSA